MTKAAPDIALTSSLAPSQRRTNARHSVVAAPDGELEPTNYFFSLGDRESVLELTYNHDGRTYDLGTGYGHIAIGVDDLDGTLSRPKEQGSSPSVRLTPCARAARDPASSPTRMRSD